MTEIERAYMKAREVVLSTMVNPGVNLLQATTALVAEYKREADKTESLHTTISVLRNMNEDGQFGARIALEQIWELLHATNQTQACENLRSLIAEAALVAEYRDRNTVLETAMAGKKR